MGKNYVESSLKRFLKRKVKITMGFVVAFMITGSIGFAINIESGSHTDIVVGDGELNITGGEFENKIYGGSADKELENSKIILNGKNIKFIKNKTSARVIAGGKDYGVNGNIELSISNFKSIDYKTQIAGGSELQKENISAKDGNSVVHIINSEIQADIRGGGFAYGKGTSITAGDSKVIVENTSVSGFEDNSNNIWTGKVFGSGSVEGGDLFKQNSTEVVINNVTGVTYNIDEDGKISDYEGTDIFGGGQSYDSAKSGKNSKLIIGSTKVTIDGEKTALDEVYGGSLISGVNNTGILETGKTEITINNGKIVSKVVGGNYSNLFGYSVIGVENTNGNYNFNGKKYNAGSIHITINGGDLSTADIIGGSYTNSYLDLSADRKTMVFGNTNININNGKTKNVIGGGVAYFEFDKKYDSPDGKDPAPESKVFGDTNINISGGNVDNVIGGGKLIVKVVSGSFPEDRLNSNTDTEGNTNINISGGNIKNVYAGGYIEGKSINISSMIKGNANITVSGGIIEENIYAGGYTDSDSGNATISGTSTITVKGGDIKGNIYGTGFGVNSNAKNSILNIDGYKNSLKTISGFDKITIGSLSDFAVSEGIQTKENSILINSGTINLADKTTIELAENSTFTNEKGGVLNVASGAIAVTGIGTAVNSGTISLKDTDNADGTISKLLSGTGSLSNQGVIVLGDKTGTITNDNWDKLLTELVTDGGNFTNGGMIVNSKNETIFSDGTVIDENTTVGNITDNGSIKVDKDVTISGTEGNTLTDVTINAEGNLTLAGKDNNTGAGVSIDKNSEINVSKDKTVTVTGTENTIGGTVNLVDNGKLEIAENSQTTISGTVSQSSGEGGSVVNKGDLVIDNAEIKVGITTDEKNSTGKVTIIDSTVEEVKASEIQVGKEEITDDFWNMFAGNTKMRMFAVANAEPEISQSIINKDITSETGLHITENSIYNGNVTVNGETGRSTLAIMDSDVEFNKNVTVKNTAGMFIGGTNGSSVKFKGNVQTDKISLADKSEAYYSADSILVNNTRTEGTIINGGKNTFEVGDNGKNALLNTSKVDGITTGVAINNSEILLDVNLTKDEVIDLGEKSVIGSDNTIALTNNSNTFYELIKMGDNKYKFTYKDDLATENGFSAELNEIFKNSQTIHDVLNKSGYETVEKRAEILDKYYSSNIYSETVKAAYDNVKLNEEAVESLARKSEIGKWTAEGKALYSKNEYDRKGIVGDYSSEIESTGLMAAYGYGINETTTAGIAFSGVKQDVDTAIGSADADLFYLGVYGNKVVGNYDFTAGLGYQFGKYEADNNILAGTGDKYDSQTVSGYVQGRYTAYLGDGLSVQPKVKLGYTYVKQDDVKDSYFGVEDAEVSTFDAEAGFDVVKSVQLEKSKVDVKFGASYIRTMGDTDEEFTGRFYGAKASEGFNVLGAELAENVVKFNLGAEVTNENGFFYNGGLTYEFGSNDTEAYGVNIGIGYKF